ncbi:MAG: hypothetical protein C0424_10565 [Sphingobacteriaceae bacterium]|nr:hypothetical protein [Sphingobacteriaceae bacterium]
MSTIHTRLEELRIGAGLSKVDFADYLGISRQRYQNMIAKEYNFRVDLIEKLVSRRPDLNIHWLFTGSGKMVSLQVANYPPVPEMAPAMVAEPPFEYGNKELLACQEKVKLLEGLLRTYLNSPPDVGPTLDHKK